MHQLDDQPFLAAAAGMDPRSISGLQLYTDAYALNGSLGYLDSVASWPDWSGLNRTVEQSVGGSQPRFLPWSAAEGNYLHLPGVASNYASTPSSAAVAITGDVDIRLRAALNAWDPGAVRALVSKQGATTTGEYSFRLVSGKLLQLIWVSGGVTQGIFQSTAAVPFSNFEIGWVRATRTSTEVSFYTSSDSVTWTQLGTTLDASSALAPDATTVPLQIGSRNSGLSELWGGRIFYAEVRNGIDGPVVARFDPNRANANSSSFVSDTGETWTINRTAIANAAKIVSAPAVMFDGTDDFMSVTTGLDMLRNVPGATMIATRRAEATGERFVFCAFGGTTATRALLVNNGTTLRTGGRRLDADAFAFNDVAGGSELAASFIHAGRLNYAGALSANFKNGALIGTENAFQTPGNTSDTNSTTLRIGVFPSPTGFWSGTISNVLVYSRALTDAEIRAVSRFLARRARAGIAV
jgi:hypothetical protein